MTVLVHDDRHKSIRGMLGLNHNLLGRINFSLFEYLVDQIRFISRINGCMVTGLVMKSRTFQIEVEQTNFAVIPGGGLRRNLC